MPINLENSAVATGLEKVFSFQNNEVDGGLVSPDVYGLQLGMGGN